MIMNSTHLCGPCVESSWARRSWTCLFSVGFVAPEPRVGSSTRTTEAKFHRRYSPFCLLTSVLSVHLHTGYKIRKTFPRNGRGANLNIFKSNFEVLVRNSEALGMRTIYRSNVIDRRSRYALNFILVLD